MDRNMRAYVAELVGTFAFVLLSAGAVCASAVGGMYGRTQAGLVGIALAAGCAYAAALALTLPFADGYLNPAVTLMLWVFKKMDGVRAAALIGVQLLGAALAGMVVRYLFLEDVLAATQLGTPHLNADFFGLRSDLAAPLGAMLKGIVAEALFAAVVTLVLFATLVDPRAVRRADGWATRLGPLWAGLAVAAVTLLGFNLTGAAANPARWFGTVFWEMTVGALQTQAPLRDHVVFWIGPVLGTLLAGGIYTTVFMPEPEAHAPVPAPVSTTSSQMVKAKK